MVKIEPKENELVICTVKEISDTSAWCELIEYPDYRALLDISEASSSFVSTLKEVIKIDKQYVAKIIKIDKEKKIVKISLKRVKDVEKKIKWEEFKKENNAKNLLEAVAKKLGVTLDKLLEDLKDVIEKYDSLYNFLTNLDKEIEKIPKKYRDGFEEILEKIKKGNEVEISYTITAISFSKKLEEMKNILSSLEKLGEIKYLGAGKYLLKKYSTNPKKDEKNILQTLENISKNFDIFEYKKNEKA